jgi:hypothetical protein
MTTRCLRVARGMRSGLGAAQPVRQTTGLKTVNPLRVNRPDAPAA